MFFHKISWIFFILKGIWRNRHIFCYTIFTDDTRNSADDEKLTDIQNRNLPTAEFNIKGQPMKFVIPSHVSKKHVAKVDPPTQRLKLDWV